MNLTFRIVYNDEMPPVREFAQAGGRAVSNTVKAHLVQLDASRRPAPGMPRSGYYGDAAQSVVTEMQGDTAVVSIPKEGMALHYYGGVVLPTAGHKALAIPKHPTAAGRRPAEIDPDRQKMFLLWPKGKKAGVLKEKSTGVTMYLLVSKATIRADATVLPAEEELTAAAAAAMEAIL